MTRPNFLRGYGYPTTRRHPRTLAEAWPHEHASAIEVYTTRVRMWETVAGVLLAVAIGVGLAAALVAWWAS